ncbi:hypothetical protein MTBLM5_30028 [Magnetospirillum sp. LM-5]|uniref:hypothetical protein n=1 Tax=Magnetospirillum sp. LM-5 TaxID=2681466 RepID=UPI0013855D67|nr:hypothetical protein [Magnetospirillum sp. LM-5]CAA7619107.1 hypothetical protein MTBLM5_30028 [Magnetospirillum sp. LM-5]
MADNPTQKQARDEMLRWASSKKGRSAIESAFKTAEANVAAFNEKIRIDTDLLRLPVTL